MLSSLAAVADDSGIFERPALGRNWLDTVLAANRCRDGSGAVAAHLDCTARSYALPSTVTIARSTELVFISPQFASSHLRHKFSPIDRGTCRPY